MKEPSDEARKYIDFIGSQLKPHQDALDAIAERLQDTALRQALAQNEKLRVSFVQDAALRQALAENEKLRGSFIQDTALRQALAENEKLRGVLGYRLALSKNRG
jgi:hypothetical protein